MSSFLVDTVDVLRRTPAAAVGPWKAYHGILLRRDDPAASPG